MRFISIVQAMLSLFIMLRVLWCDNSPWEIFFIPSLINFSLAWMNYELDID